MSSSPVVHYQLDDQEHMAVSEAKRRGAVFDRPEMLCRTGDGHAMGTRVWVSVTCPACRIKGGVQPDPRAAQLVSEVADLLERHGDHAFDEGGPL